MSAKNDMWERIEQVMAVKGWEQADLCRATGVTDGSLSTFKRRARLKPSARLSGDNIQKIVDGAGVSYAWLATGEGEPWPKADVVLELDDPYDSRAELVRVARGEGVPNGVLEALQVERKHKGDPGRAYWEKKLEGLMTSRKTVRKLIPEDDTFD